MTRPRAPWPPRYAIVSLLAVLAGCVQPAYDRTILFELDVSGVPNVQSVGVRGADKPLSWRRDAPMTQRVPSGPYVVAITYHTGFLATEVKFAVNGELEFTDKENRIVRMAPTSSNDTTVYRAKFNVR